jgi:hypothetical protein
LKRKFSCISANSTIEIIKEKLENQEKKIENQENEISELKNLLKSLILIKN